MSLIFKALKKMEAERERPAGTQPPQIEPILPERPKIPWRFIALAVVLCVGFGLLLVTRFMRNKGATPLGQANAAQALQTAQNTTVALEQKAMQSFEEKRLSESKALWEELTLISPTDADVYNNLGLTLKHLGQKKEAYQAYQKALALAPTHPQALNNIGVLFWNDGQREEAKNHFQKAVAADPKYADPHFHLAVILEQEGNVKTAATHYREFLAQKPSLVEAQQKKILEKAQALEEK